MPLCLCADDGAGFNVVTQMCFCLAVEEKIGGAEVKFSRRMKNVNFERKTLERGLWSAREN